MDELWRLLAPRGHGDETPPCRASRTRRDRRPSHSSRGPCAMASATSARCVGWTSLAGALTRSRANQVARANVWPVRIPSRHLARTAAVVQGDLHLFHESVRRLALVALEGVGADDGPLGEAWARCRRGSRSPSSSRPTSAPPDHARDGDRRRPPAESSRPSISRRAAESHDDHARAGDAGPPRGCGSRSPTFAENFSASRAPRTSPSAR